MRDLNDDEQALAFRFAHVALPSDAHDCEPWVWHADAWRRFFTVKEWNVGDIWVCVSGEQTNRGAVTRWVHVGGDGQCTSADRQHLIAALTDAGKLLDSLGR